MTTSLTEGVGRYAIVAAIVTLIGTVFVALIRAIGPWSKQIADLERRMRTELRQEKARCEGELKVVKHRERRTRAMLYSTLRLFDVEQDKRKPLLDRIFDELAAIEKAEAEESATLSLGLLDEQGHDHAD